MKFKHTNRENAARSEEAACWDVSKIRLKGTGHNEAAGIACIIYWVWGTLRKKTYWAERIWSMKNKLRTSKQQQHERESRSEDEWGEGGRAGGLWTCHLYFTGRENETLKKQLRVIHPWFSSQTEPLSLVHLLIDIIRWRTVEALRGLNGRLNSV